MFKDNEFQQWCLKLNFSEPAVQVVSRVRESEPSRRVGGGRKNVSGVYASLKMGRGIQFESNKVELPGLYIKEFDDNVIEMYDQPPAIKLSYKSLKEKTVAIYHTPDYFVIYKDKAGWEEWKSEDELQKLANESPNRYVLDNGKWRCPPGEEYASQFGLHYWLKSSGEINWTLQRNLIFLGDYLKDVSTRLSTEVTGSILSKVKNQPGILLADLLRDNNIFADDIYYLIARSKIYVDLKEEVLTEPEFTHVFIDKQTYLAYKTTLSRKRAPLLEDHSLEIAPGVKVVWDGKPWTIVNIGNTSISLLANEDIIEIPKVQFINLANENRIKAVTGSIIKKVNIVMSTMISEASEQELVEANRRYEIILPILEGAKITDIKDITVTSRTIFNWVKAFKEAENKLGFGYLGLIPRKSQRGNKTNHLSEDTLVTMNAFIEKNESVKNQSKIVLYGKFVKICEEKGLIVPCKKTFYKAINIRPRYQHIFKTLGGRAAEEKAPLYMELTMTTPRHGERAFEIAHLDHTQIDIELVHSTTGKNLKKPWLSIMMDAYSRRVLAFFLTFDAPSYRTNMMIIRECVRRFNRLPEVIFTDNGKDFKSEYFQSLLTMYGSSYKYRPPHKPRFGSVGERIFGTTTTQLIHNLAGNTKIMKNVRQVTKSVNPKNHSVWTLSALYDLFREYFYEFYDTVEHSTLGESPREVFERSNLSSGKRPVTFIPYNKDFILMTLPKPKRNNGTAKVDPQRGVKVNYFYYQCDEFYRADIAGERVAVRYDPWNMGIVYCYINGKWVKCYSQYYAVFNGKSELFIKIASEELKEQKKKHAKNPEISAKELANFISSAEATEDVLKQAMYDGEIEPQVFSVIEGGLTEPSGEETVSQIPVFDYDQKIVFDLKNGIEFD